MLHHRNAKSKPTKSSEFIIFRHKIPYNLKLSFYQSHVSESATEGGGLLI